MKRLERVPPKFKKQVEARLREVPQLIKERREVLGLTQEELAEKLEIGLDTMKAVETGRRFPSLPMLFYIFEFLKIEIRFRT